MASTPPAQIRAEAQTPPTPLHGSAYHSKSSPSRYNTRSNTKKTPESPQSSFTSPQSSRTPRSPEQDPFHSASQVTPKRKSTRRVQVISPTSPDSDTPARNIHQHNPAYLSATTILSEGMLPTPDKTPQKKHIPKATMAARALFQDQPNAMHQSPRKTQKKRHNGFSLESFSAATSSQDPVQIHVDSRDQVPEVDTSAENPFNAVPPTESKKRAAPSRQKMTSATKRRKVSAEEDEKRPLDPQVEEAIERDEGMVYVFRGKKVYRRFDDAGEEEEVIDPEELGLLEREVNGRDLVRPLKTLTRKSIKPRRLFQDEPSAQRVPQQASQSDEEAETEIDDNHPAENDEQELPSPSRATRSRTRDVSNSAGSKKRSPFDAWPRLKSGARSSGSVPASKGRKRTAAEALEV
ncbi:hypothetical protein PMZ80_010879 [Knufia obscura]|uniref:Uncharacterized protein n=2 Tax=Knufia TaxID=430999 RepID=A0AAN8EIR9_9EURO|nr:hypothetical protein PMZ80_010879 [Knufia obscura]KAK5951792.1 hypothetical protein OHC33_007084 [Knufia fluminis]